MRTNKKNKSLRGIKEIRKGVYLIRVQKLDPRTGKPTDVRRQVECESLSAAAVMQAKLLEEIQAGEKVQERMRLQEYAQTWLAARLPTLKASTQSRYTRDLQLHILPDLGKFYLDALRAEDVHTWFGKKASEFSAATANGYLRLLKVVMGDAVAQYRLPLDPTRRIRAMPELRRDEMASDEPVNLLSGEEMGRFLALLKQRWPQWYALVFVQFATARRFGEVSALRWEDIDEKASVIKIRRSHWQCIVDTPKTGQVVHVPLTEELHDVLRSWHETLVQSRHRHLESGWVFPSRVGKPHHNAACMGKAFIDCLREMGFDRRFSSHGLRRTANDLLRRVASGEVTRAITGHMTAAMTEHYSHVDAGEKKVAVQRMLQLVQGEQISTPAGTRVHGRYQTGISTGIDVQKQA
jgi:integrase